jgi:hypothetical protein
VGRTPRFPQRAVQTVRDRRPRAENYARILRAHERGPVEHRWLRGVSVRFAVNHLFDVEPPIADETNGTAAGTANSRGRQFVLDLTQRF